MMDPNTATWMAGRAEPNRDRDAEQTAALRDAGSADSAGFRPTAERVQAFFTRTSRPVSASCDCADC